MLNDFPHDICSGCVLTAWLQSLQTRLEDLEWKVPCKIEASHVDYFMSIPEECRTLSKWQYSDTGIGVKFLSDDGGFEINCVRINFELQSHMYPRINGRLLKSNSQSQLLDRYDNPTTDKALNHHAISDEFINALEINDFVIPQLITNPTNVCMENLAKVEASILSGFLRTIEKILDLVGFGNFFLNQPGNLNSFTDWMVSRWSTRKGEKVKLCLDPTAKFWSTVMLQIFSPQRSCTVSQIASGYKVTLSEDLFAALDDVIGSLSALSPDASDDSASAINLRANVKDCISEMLKLTPNDPFLEFFSAMCRDNTSEGECK